MKVGLSTYSLSRAISAGELDILSAIQWIADNGGEHVEISPSNINLKTNDEFIKSIVAKTKEVNLDISSYTIGANFIQKTEKAYEEEIKRIKREVDVANALGVKLMRHDAASRPVEETSVEQFDRDLPKCAAACTQIADYAKQYGITTSVENHGLHMQAAERIQRLILAVNRDNFKTTMDIGNFVCVDETALVSVKKNIKYASMIHVKDFHLKDSAYNPGEGWVRTSAGNYWRGAIAGHGDIHLDLILKVIKDAGFDGYLSIEFEGMEECRLGSRIGMENTKRLWELA